MTYFGGKNPLSLSLSLSTVHKNETLINYYEFDNPNVLNFAMASQSIIEVTMFAFRSPK
jgi:hypothetical protein